MKKFTLVLSLMLLCVFVFAQKSNFNDSDPNAAQQTAFTKAAWTLQFNHQGMPTTGSAGCETDGTYFYVTKWSGDTIWKYNMSGTLVSSFTIPGVSGLRDLAYDGTHFYGGKNTALFYKMDFNSTPPKLVKTISCPSGTTVRNICYQPDSNAFWVAGWSTDLKLIDTMGNVLRTIPSATHGFNSCYGTAYDNVSPGGPYIWWINAASTTGVITQINATTGAPTGISHTCSDVGTQIGGGLWIQPNIVGNTVTLGGLLQNEAIFGYDLASTVPDTFDLAVNTIDVNPLVPIGQAVTIDGEIENMGTATITAMDLNYQIDNGTPVTQSLTGLNIASFTTYNYAHGTTWTPTAGVHTIKVWTSNPNGHTDQYTGNDTMTITVTGYDPASSVQRLPLHEAFTSSTCGPCVAGNQALAAAFNANANKWTCVKYQMSWPGNGDPYFTQEGYTRRLFYGVSSVPRLEVDGGWDANTSSYTSTLLNQYYANPSFCDITAEYSVGGQVVDVDVTVTPKIDFPSSANRLYIAVIENKTTQNVGSNGETEFDYVMKKMLPDAAGHTLGALTANTAKTHAEHYEFKGSFRLPNNANDPINHAIEHSVEEFSDLSVVVWVQDYNTMEVLQSAWATKVAGIEENDGNGIIAAFPNPANDQFVLRYFVKNSSDVNMVMYNHLGQKVNEVNKGTQDFGHYTQTFDVSNLDSGIYFLSLTIDGKVYTQKMVVK